MPTPGNEGITPCDTGWCEDICAGLGGDPDWVFYRYNPTVGRWEAYSISALSAGAPFSHRNVDGSWVEV